MFGLFWKPAPPPPPRGLFGTIWDYKIFFVTVGVLAYSLYYQWKNTKKDKRTLIINEIIATERTYVQTIQLLFQHFINPLNEKIESKKTSLTSAELKKAFPPTLEVIKNTNETFLAKLEYRISPWKILQLIITPLLQKAPTLEPFLGNQTRSEVTPSMQIGDIFVQMAPYFKCYIPYVNQFDQAREEVDALKASNTKFRDFLKKCETANPELNLASLMICPVQRLPRYILLLNELLKNTDKTHADYKQIELALEKMKEVTASLNTGKARSDNLARVFQLEQQLKLPHSLSRMLLKEGELLYSIDGKKKEPKLVNVWLFSDIFVFGSPLGNDKVKVSGIISLKGINFVPEGANGFVVKLPKGSNRFTSKQGDSNNSWIDSMKEAISNNFVRA